MDGYFVLTIVENELDKISALSFEVKEMTVMSEGFDGISLFVKASVFSEGSDCNSMDDGAIAVLDEKMSCLEKATLPVVDTTELGSLGPVEEAVSLLEVVDTEKLKALVYLFNRNWA